MDATTMDATIWTIIGAAIGLFVALSAMMQLSIMSLRNELRAEIRQAVAGFKRDLAELRAEFKQDTAEIKQSTAEMRAESKQDMVEMRAEFKQDMVEMRAEFKQDMAEMRAEFKRDLAASNSDLSGKIQANRAEIIANRRLLYRFSLHRHGDDGLPLAPLTDALEPPDFGGDNGEGGNPAD